MGQILTADGPIDAPPKVLVVVAHPDDIDFGTAGTIASLTDAGSEVVYCLVTSGEAGDDDMTVPAEQLAELRQREQTEAAGIVGVSELHWLGHPDGAVVADLNLRRDISRIIRMTMPSVVVTQSAVRNLNRIYGSHPDHLATGEATISAVYPDSRNPRAFPELLEEGLEPHPVPEVWVTGLDPDRFIDITDVFDRKVEALRAHKSQTEKMGDRLPELLREWGEGTAEQARFDRGRVAEAFKVVSTA
ncbi:MAG: PIG-L family deacetylase [Actinomycetia bacterium]|nr:PIG-L family deacetylase [Actinomycetes bacterium]MCP4961543.1 PIG-L family deacetylase [Actinomycetes bacterium]